MKRTILNARCGSLLLTGISVAGVILAAVTSSLAAPKAVKLIEKRESEEGKPLQSVEKFETVWRVYIPTAAVCLGTSVCIIGAHLLDKRQINRINGAYIMLREAFTKYRKKATDLYGSDADLKIRTEIARDIYNAEEQWRITPALGWEDEHCDKRLFYDSYGERYFEAPFERVMEAEYHINRNNVLRGGCELNEFYEMLGLPPLEKCNGVGWNTAEGYYWIDFSNEKAVMDDGLECIIISDAMGVSYLEDY